MTARKPKRASPPKGLAEPREPIPAMPGPVAAEALPEAVCTPPLSTRERAREPYEIMRQSLQDCESDMDRFITIALYYARMAGIDGRRFDA